MEEIFKIYKITTDRWGKRERVYEVSNLGRVKVNGVISEPSLLNSGYLTINHILVHRAVAELFIPNPENKPEVDHIDTNPLNNVVDNLRWVTSSENKRNELTRKHMSEVQIGHVCSDEVRQSMSVRKKGENNPMYGKGYKVEGSKNGMYGKSAVKGKKWMNNGKEEMYVIPPWDQDMIIFGWEYGRLKRKRSK